MADDSVKKYIEPEKNEKSRLMQLIPYRLPAFESLNLKVDKIACGTGFSLFSCHDSKNKLLLFGCGINTDSQLGYFPSKSKGNNYNPSLFLSQPNKLNLPTSLHNSDHEVRSLDCGRAHTIIAFENDVIGLGNNSFGQLGRRIIEGEIYSSSLQINKINIRESVKKVVCGFDHTLLLTDCGKVFAFGLGSDGQTGQGNNDTCCEPTLVKGDIETENIIDISSSADTCLAVSKHGEIFGWGNSEYSQLDVGFPNAMQVDKAVHLKFDCGKIIQSACGGSICAILNESGQVFTWGYGILGKGPRFQMSKTPKLIPEILFGKNEFKPNSKVVKIACGLNHFAALNDSGDIYTWGKNKFAVLGLGHKLDQFFPIKVLLPAEANDVFCGTDHMIVKSKSYA